jgi:hypothetical protein
MVFHDWRRPLAYVSTEGLDAAHWAWEFLRRNPRYQADWQILDAVWQALEARYGRPPDRDFCARRLDPCAWVRAADCLEGTCRVDGDRV